MNTRMHLLAAALMTFAAGPVRAQAPVLDNHYLDTGEVFIASQEASEGGYTAVAVARMLQAPSAQTRGEGLFLVVGPGAGYAAGQRVWTRFYWRTRIATPEDIRLGKDVFASDLTQDGIYRQPNDRQESLNAGWWTGAITDLTDLYKQQVTVAGDYHVHIGALRVLR